MSQPILVIVSLSFDGIEHTSVIIPSSKKEALNPFILILFLDLTASYSTEAYNTESFTGSISDICNLSSIITLLERSPDSTINVPRICIAFGN